MALPRGSRGQGARGPRLTLFVDQFWRQKSLFYVHKPLLPFLSVPTLLFTNPGYATAWNFEKNEKS